MRTTRRLPWVRWGLTLAAVLAGAWLFWAGRGIWFPVAIAFVIAMVLDPYVDRLENRGLPRNAASGVVFLLFLTATAGPVILLTPVLSQQAASIASDLGTLFPNPEQPDLVPATQRVLARLEAHPALRDALLGAARTGTERLSSTLQRTSELVLLWAPNLVWFLVVPVLAFYLLNDFHRIYAKVILLVPVRHRPETQTIIAEISALFGKYVRGLALLCLLLGLAIAGLLLGLGVRYWQFLGLLGGLLYAVPVVGPLCTLGLVALVALVTGSTSQMLLATSSLLLLTHGLFDQVLTPRVLGRQVGLHPVLTILALLLGFQVWGITGMLVAVPLAASIQTVIVHLVPKLGLELDLRPLQELQETEDATREEHLQAEEPTLDEHFCLHAVVENVER